MAWDTEMVVLLRNLIGDTATPYEFSDDRLEELIVVASQFVIMDLDFKNVYSVDAENLTLSPDPTQGDKDNAFINLVVVKAACLVDQSLYRTKAKQAGISVRSGSEVITTGGLLAGYKYLLEKGGWCPVYQQMKFDYYMNNESVGQAIIGPYAGGHF